MSMDKTGVCPGEGEAPKPGEKAAQDQPKVGGDLLSRMSETAGAGDKPKPQSGTDRQ